MHFLEPWGLLGLLGLGPIIALYFLKLRREQRVVPSTLLWKKVIQDLHVNAPFQRLRYSLLLLFQLLVVALLGYALARPFLTLPGLEGKRIVLLLDTSASMATYDAGPEGKRSRLEQAIEDAKAKIDDLPYTGEMRIVAFDEEVRQLTPFSSDKALLKQVLSGLTPRHLRTNAQEAFESALAMTEEKPNTEILVLTDGGFDRLSLMRLLGTAVEGKNTEEASLDKLGRFHFVPYGKLETDNVGITNIGARTRPLPEGEEPEKGAGETLQTQIFVQIENFSSQDKDVILSLATPEQPFPPKVIKLKARPRQEATLSDQAEKGQTLEASRSQEVFVLTHRESAVVTATLTSPQDGLALDNQASVVVGHSEGVKLLLVSNGNYFLRKAFLAMPGSAVTELSPEKFQEAWTATGPRAVKDFDVVVFEGHRPPSWEDGGAIFLNALPPLPGFKELKEAKPREYPLIIDWDNRHPVMRYVTFANVRVARVEPWEFPKTASVLVEGFGGPLIVAFETDRVHAVGVAFDLFQSDWPYRSSLPIFLRNAVLWASEASPRRQPAMQRTGTPLAIPPIPGAGAQWKARLLKPDGSSQDLAVSAERKQFIKGIERAGLYKLTGLPGDVPERTFAVNLADPQESDNLARRELSVGESQLRPSSVGLAGKNEFWRTLVLAAVGLLLAEWLVYHRRLGL